MLSVRPKFKALSLRVDKSTGGVKMPLAQAHPFQPIPVTHEEEMFEVSTSYLDVQRVQLHFPFYFLH